MTYEQLRINGKAYTWFAISKLVFLANAKCKALYSNGYGANSQIRNGFQVQAYKRGIEECQK